MGYFWILKAQACLVKSPERTKKNLEMKLKPFGHRPLVLSSVFVQPWTCSSSGTDIWATLVPNRAVLAFHSGIWWSQATGKTPYCVWHSICLVWFSEFSRRNVINELCGWRSTSLGWGALQAAAQTSSVVVVSTWDLPFYLFINL